MSGTIASRFQGRFGYQPGLRTGTYPGQTQGALPPAPLGTPGTAAPTPAAPVAQPAATPVSAGSMAGVDEPRGDGPEGGANTYGDMGAAPGSLGTAGGFGSGFGVSNYGTVGSALGGLAGLATGVPGLGTVGSAIGTAMDVNNANGTLADYGFSPIGFAGGLSAFGNNATFGLAGQSLTDQMADIPGFAGTIGMGAMGRSLDAEAAQTGGPEGAFGGLADVAGMDVGYGDEMGDYGNTGDFGPAGQTAEEAAQTNAMAMGLEGYGFGTDPSNGMGSGNFGAMSAAERGESVGAPGGGYNGDPNYGGNDPGGPGPGDPGDDAGGDGHGNMDGGYTGAGPDGVVQPTQEAEGPVHEGEAVLKAEATAYYGMPLLMALNNMEIPRSRLAALVRGE